MAQPDHLSISQARMYMRCPLQYYFRYCLGLKIPPTGAMTLGRTVHETLETNFVQKVDTRTDLGLDEMVDTFSDRWSLNIPDTQWQEMDSPGQLKDDGVGLVETYHVDVSPMIQPAEVELEFLVETSASRPLMGRIDLVDEHTTIIDHKITRRSLPVEAVQTDIQLTGYSYAWRALHPFEEERGVRLDVLVRTREPKVQTLEGRRSQGDLDRFLRILERVEQGIGHEIFYPSETAFCSACGYRERCSEW